MTVDQTDMFGPVGEADDDCLVVPVQCPIEVFTNDAGGITIRQDQTAWMGETVFVALSTEHAVRALIAALQREIGDTG